MAGSRFDLTSRMVVLCIVILFLGAYLFQNLLVGLVGTGMLFYLVYRRMEFHSLVGRVDLRTDRKIMETVVHRGSPMTVSVRISSDEKVMLQVNEQVPDDFQLVSGDTSFNGRAGPDSALEHSYTLMPMERGLFKMDPPHIRMSENRGLFQTSFRSGPVTEVFVRTSKKEILLARLMSKRKQFEITGPANRRHTRTHRADFRSVRDYVSGDRFRDMDWKASSRLTKLMTKEFEQETNLPTLIMVDASLSMRELVKKSSKMDHAIALALQIAVVMERHHHPVGLITFDENRVIDHLSPGKQDIDDLLMALFKLPNPLETGAYPGSPRESGGGQKANGEDVFLNSVGPFLVKGRRSSYSREMSTGIFEAVRTADKVEETGQLMVLITDLETNLPSLLKAVNLALRRKHRLIVVSPFSWPYHLERDRTTPEQLERAYLDRMHKQNTIKGLRGAGVKVIEIGPSERGDSVVAGLRRMSQ
ncbi:MAG: DUF58 domain-containing protein [Thermoplasmatota archaeon]